MPSWEARKARTWKMSNRGRLTDFSKDFWMRVEGEVTPYIKESFLRLLAESKDNRMNSVELSVSLKGKKLNKVV
jgi:hypothetical protein